MKRTADPAKFLPLAITLGFYAFVFFVTVAGPIDFVDFDAWKVGFFLSALGVAITVGYVLGVQSPMAQPRSHDPVRNVKTMKRVFKYALIVAVLGFVINLVLTIATGALNFNVGETYKSLYQDYEKNSGHYSLPFLIYTALAAPIFIVTILGLHFFRRLPRLWRIAVVVVAFGSPLVFTLSSGTQKTIGDVIIYMCALFLVSFGNGRMPIKPRTMVLTAIAAVGGLSAMATVLAQRFATAGITGDNINANTSDLMRFRLDHPVFQILGMDLGFVVSELCNYLTNGFNGLSYSLNAPPTWSFMFGSSYSMSVIGQRVLGLPFAYEYTYPYLAGIRSGWGETLWYSGFSWFASDFTFFGVVPLFGLFAYAYGRCWLESIRFRNPFSIMLFCLMTLGMIMMTANNQIMQTPGGLLTLIVTVVLYIRYRRRFNTALPYA